MPSYSFKTDEKYKTPFGFGTLISLRESNVDVPECAIVQLSFGTAYLSLVSISQIVDKTKTVEKINSEKEENIDGDKKYTGDDKKVDDDEVDNDDNEEEDDDDEDDEDDEEEETPSKLKKRFGSKVAAARTKKMIKARENFQRRTEAAAAAAATVSGNGSNYIVELKEGEDDIVEGKDNSATLLSKTPSTNKSLASNLSPKTPASQQTRSPITTVVKGTPLGSSIPMTEAKRALAEAKRAELLLRSPVMQKQPRELTEAQKAALASKGVLKELIVENDLGSGGANSGGTGVLEAIAAVEVGEGLGGLLSTVAAITVVGACVGGLYMMMRRR
jgi:hypothetical protein